jgi:hypothetical protein
MHYSRKSQKSIRSFHFVCYEFLIDNKIIGKGSASHSLQNGFDIPLLIELIRDDVRKDFENCYRVDIMILSVHNLTRKEYKL